MHFFSPTCKDSQ
jgi:hypothetical protein